jgi:acyl-CoA synthetase (AMP-forming)/AMP-acid ligase II
MITKGFRNVNEIYNDFVINTSPEKILFYFEGKAINKFQFSNRVDEITRHLINLRITRGSMVGYTIPTAPDAFALFISISRLGACAIPIFHMVPDASKVGIFNLAKADVVITTSGLFSGIKEQVSRVKASFKIITLDSCNNCEYCMADVNLDDDLLKGKILNEMPSQLPLLLASSSGTTGIPKIVMMSQGNVASVIYVSEELVDPMLPGGEISSMAFPLSTAGVVVCLGFLFAGCTMVLTADISAVKFMELVSKYKSNSLACPPAFYEAILSLPMLHSFDLSSVKKIYTGMDFLTPSLVERLKEKFINIEGFGNGYGLIETSNIFMTCKCLNEKELLTTPTSKMVLACGANEIKIKDTDGNEVPIGEQGELYVKGLNVVGGYINNIEETNASFNDGWFRTGDIVRYESENCITLLGRKKYLIKRGGKSVSPIVVQNKINELKGIKTSAVVGVPHALYGEMVWGFIVKDSDSGISFKDVMKHCRAELVNYMVPDQILFIDEIPKNPGVGKVNYEKLRQIANNELKSMEGK